MHVFDEQGNQYDKQATLKYDEVDPAVSEEEHQADDCDAKDACGCNHYYIVVSIILRQLFISKQHQVKTKRTEQ